MTLCLGTWPKICDNFVIRTKGCYLKYVFAAVIALIYIYQSGKGVVVDVDTRKKRYEEMAAFLKTKEGQQILKRHIDKMKALPAKIIPTAPPVHAKKLKQISIPVTTSLNEMGRNYEKFRNSSEKKYSQLYNQVFNSLNESSQNYLSDLQNEIENQGLTFKVGPTSVFDQDPNEISGGLTGDDEFEKGFYSEIIGDNLSEHEQEIVKCTQRPLHSGIYWPPVKDQGLCGSCWAFAVTGMMEINHLVQTNKTRPTFFSEQFLLDCSGAGNCQKGGYVSRALHFLSENGAISQDERPYKGTQNQCAKDQTFTFAGRLHDWGIIAVNSDLPTIQEKIKMAICRMGSVVGNISITPRFQAYAGGVFDESNEEGPFHSVVIIGWDDTRDSWIIRNSWGPRWGTGGIAHIRFHKTLLDKKVYWLRLKDN
jgi:C1A family cysteine protease